MYARKPWPALAGLSSALACLSSALACLSSALAVALCLGGCAGDLPASQSIDAESVPGPPAQLSPGEPAARFPGRDPSLTFSTDGALHVAYVTESEDGPRVAYRLVDRAAALGEPVLVSPPSLEVSAHGEVPPVVEVLGDGTLVVAYAVSLPGKWLGEIRVQRSSDQGRTWTTPELLHDDSKVGSHSFLDATVNARGEAVFSWLDNRGGQQGLRTAVLSSGGEISANRTADPVTCQCCATALLAGPGERMWLAYRDLEDGDVRDVVLARSDDAGQSFERLGPVSADTWRLEGCPHTGPRLAHGQDGTLWTAWFTGAEPGIYVAASRDGGETFTPRRNIERAGGEIVGVAHPEIGRLPDGRLAVFYEEYRDGDKAVLARTADAEGHAWGPPHRVAAGAVYPRYATDGRQAVVLVTRRTGGDSEIVLHRFGTNG